MERLIILCLLGDPHIPAVSVDHTGGFQVDVQELLYNLLHAPYDIHIITNTSQYCTDLYEKNKNYTIHRISFDNTWLEDQNLMMTYYDKIRDDFFNILSSLLTDRLIIHSFYWLSGILASDAMKRYHIKYVHSVVSLSIGKTLAGSSPYFSRQMEFEKVFLKNASVIFSITDAEKEQLEEYYSIDESHIEIIGRDVHPAFINPSHSSDGTPRNIKKCEEISDVELLKYPWWYQGAFTYIGRLNKIKGLQYIISAWLRLYSEYGMSTPPLWICGGTPNVIKSFRKTIEDFFDVDILNEHEKNQKIIWWGYLDSAGISTLLLKTRVLVTHSMYEPGGRVLLEAFASSVPVIATPNGFAKDLIVNKANGMLVEYGDVDKLKSTMEYFMMSNIQLLKMKECARQTYITQHKKWRCYDKQIYAYAKCGLTYFHIY